MVYFVIIGIAILLLAAWLVYTMIKQSWHKDLAQKIAKMSDAKINSRHCSLFYELEEQYSPKKALEYNMLMAEHLKRTSKK